MSDAPVKDDEVVVECDLDEAPEKVWRALTEPALVAEWLFPGDVKTGEGERFALDGDDGRVDCEVVEAEEGRRLAYSWRDETARREGFASTVSFELTPAGAGTRLRIVHGDFRRIAARAAAPVAANTNTPPVMRLAA